jgi:two-component system cell cycle response regulator DivK
MDGMQTILNIEDNPENRLLIRRLLESRGYQVFEAESAAQALEYISIQKPDLVLIDINMPDMDGYVLTSLLRSKPSLKNVPMIAVTANVLKGDRERSLQAGCDDYIEKPIDVDNFLAQVEKCLK